MKVSFVMGVELVRASVGECAEEVRLALQDDPVRLRRTRIAAFALLSVLSAAAAVLGIVSGDLQGRHGGPINVVAGFALSAGCLVLLTLTIVHRLPGEGAGNEAPESGKRPAFIGRMIAGATGIAVGTVLLVKGGLALYVAPIGGLFILAGAAVMLLAVRWSREL